MSNILENILEVKKDEVRKLRRDYSISRFRDSRFFNTEKISILDKINSNDRISIIAEIKKASPSKGIIRENFNHMEIADVYMENEVDAISVLTDEMFFMGHKNYLTEIAGIKTVPLLRKDFIIDDYQIFESKSIGADVILLIAEMLSKTQIKELTHAAFENGLEVLLELHSEDQIGKIDFSLNNLIGINNRNLNDFNVDLNATIELRKLIPETTAVVSESGIKTRDDISRLLDSHVNAILVGEHLMKSSNIGEEVKKMMEWCTYES